VDAFLFLRVWPIQVAASNPAARVRASVSYEVGESAEGAPEVAVEILWVVKWE
jgi:hypothetical protein